MSAVVYDCEIVGTVVFVAEVRESLVQCRFPAFGRNLEIFRLEVELILE